MCWEDTKILTWKPGNIGRWPGCPGGGPLIGLKFGPKFAWNININYLIKLSLKCSLKFGLMPGCRVHGHQVADKSFMHLSSFNLWHFLAVCHKE